MNYTKNDLDSLRTERGRLDRAIAELKRVAKQRESQESPQPQDPQEIADQNLLAKMTTRW